jgi:hypothetical protein
MIIRNFGTVASGDARVTSAIVSWEDRVYPDQELHFEIHDDELDARQGTDESIADAFLSACFPLAAVHGEARVRIEGQPCPMLIEGLYTAHAGGQVGAECPLALRKSRLPSGDAAAILGARAAPSASYRAASTVSTC